LGLLHGIPISVKDFILQKGKLSTWGLAHLSLEHEKEDAPVLKQYVRAGAIPLVKGNVPMLGAAIHTNNFVFGEVSHPFDLSRTSGGSSGGDAGLIAARCIPLNISID
jgi:Asp-tRNA(Asn)/Glu-tRNA(Gln) amidotransferase A subunit family amidase